VRAPRLRGRGWLNTDGELTLADLRGRIVLLDFWTFACINCLHVLEELRPLQERFADVLVTIGVHSPKFPHEQDPATLAAAVERYSVHHPVLDDPDLLTWDAYAAKAWPTLVVVDPTGHVVDHRAGEGHAAALGELIERLIAEHEAAGTLRRGPEPYVAPPATGSRLLFPGKVIALGDGTFLLSDTAHHQVVQMDADLVTEVRRFGTGRRGRDDGAAPTFAEPQGLLLLPATVAEAAGYDVVVADSLNHALRGLRLGDGVVRTLAGDGHQLTTRVAVGAGSARLSSPWDLAWWGERVVIAMAGSHQLWTFDPRDGRVSVLAGTTTEGLRDGPGGTAFFAQPSGLATDGRGALWVADAETSALRQVVAGTGAEGSPQTVTAVGQGLFDFGFRDGSADVEARLQHPLGVAVLPDGSIAVADTYNGAVRRHDPRTRLVSTLAHDLQEPSDLVVDGDDLIVVESAGHRLTRLPIPAAARARARPDAPDRLDLAPGKIRLEVTFEPPIGQHLDRRFGEPTSLGVTAAASTTARLEAGAGTAPGLSRTLELDGRPGDEVVLRVAAVAAACDEDDSQFAACHRYQQDWVVAVRLSPGAPAGLTLALRPPPT
jgi:thiol-disulfide isomerase/thioredoxin